MTTARLVPVTTEMDGGGSTRRTPGTWPGGTGRVAVSSFVRFRYGDGFTNCRAGRAVPGPPGRPERRAS